MMNPDTKPPNYLHDSLERYRMDCLNYYTASLRAQGKPFESEASLLIRVRGGMLMDIIIESLKNENRTDNSARFHDCARQLLGAGYNYDNIKIMYDVMEKCIIETLQPLPDKTKLSFRPLKSALQLARVVAVNQYLLQVNSNLNEKNKAAPVVPKLTQPPEPARPVARSVPESSPSPKTFENMPMVGVPKDYIGARIDWPLRIVAGTKPPEYLARLENGNRVQVLLVDKPESYERTGRLDDGIVRCRLRFIGPLILAYPY
jgi:hypothetical protein